MRIIPTTRYIIANTFNDQIRILGFARYKKDVLAIVKKLNLNEIIVIPIKHYRKVY